MHFHPFKKFLFFATLPDTIPAYVKNHGFFFAKFRKEAGELPDRKSSGSRSVKSENNFVNTLK